MIKNAPIGQRYIAVLYQMRNLQNVAQKSRLALDSILEYAQKENDQFLRWESYVAWAKYMAETSQQLNKKLVFFNEVWPFIKNCDEDEIKGFYYHELGKVYYQSRDFDNAFRYIVKATDIFERIGYNHLRLRALYTCDLFSFYYRFKDYPLAARYSKLSVSLNDTFLPRSSQG